MLIGRGIRVYWGWGGGSINVGVQSVAVGGGGSISDCEGSETVCS